MKVTMTETTLNTGITLLWASKTERRKAYMYVSSETGLWFAMVMALEKFRSPKLYLFRKNTFLSEKHSITDPLFDRE